MQPPPPHHLTTPPEVTGRLHELVDELLQVNRQYNLTALRDPGEAWVKHVVDSLHGLQTGLFEGPLRVADVGAGAGFPGLPLAIARPELRLTFIEATHKKCDFIRSMVDKFGLQADVLCRRAEEVGQDSGSREQYDVATARAVGSLSEVCELCLPLVRVGGHAVLWRGERAQQEADRAVQALQTLGGQVREVAEYGLEGHATRYHLVVIGKTGATPAGYPRRVGLPKQRPL